MDLPNVDLTMLSTTALEVQLAFSVDSSSLDATETLSHPPSSLALKVLRQWGGILSEFCSGFHDDLASYPDAGQLLSLGRNAAEPSPTPVSSYTGDSDLDLFNNASDSSDSVDAFVLDLQLEMDVTLVQGVNDAWLWFPEMYTCLSTWGELISSVSVAEPNEVDVVYKGTHELRPVLRAAV